MSMEFVFLGIISTISTIICIQLLNRNWFLRQKLKYDLECKKLKYKQKLSKMKLKQPDTPIEGLGQYTKWLPLLKGLDSEQIQDLIGIVTGGGDAQLEEDNPLSSIISNIPPEVINGFLQGLTDKTGEKKTGNY